VITVDVFREGGLGPRREHSVPEHEAIRAIRVTGPTGRTEVRWADGHREHFKHDPATWCLVGPAGSRLQDYDDRGRIWFHEPTK
jgi:hypothetical protein